MKSQWYCIQQNIGTWHGSFTQFSPEGRQIKDTPSVLTLVETDPGQKMQLTLERTPLNASPEVTRRDFSAPGMAPYVYFFESGAFSQGSAQWAIFGQFGAEMSIKLGDRRVRFVIMYDSTSDGMSCLKYVTLIRETQAGGTPFTEPSVTVKQLTGNWKGEADVLYATMAPMTTGESFWQLTDELICQEQLDKATQVTQSLSLIRQGQAAVAEQTPIILKASGEGLIYQLMLLPNGAYCLLPQCIQKDYAFRVEVGWVRPVDGPVDAWVRSRLMRNYDSRGIWTHSVLIEDALIQN